MASFKDLSWVLFFPPGLVFFFHPPQSLLPSTHMGMGT